MNFFVLIYGQERKRNSEVINVLLKHGFDVGHKAIDVLMTQQRAARVAYAWVHKNHNKPVDCDAWGAKEKLITGTVAHLIPVYDELNVVDRLVDVLEKEMLILFPTTITRAFMPSRSLTHKEDMRMFLEHQKHWYSSFPLEVYHNGKSLVGQAGVSSSCPPSIYFIGQVHRAERGSSSN